jgi:hypothetical protein
MSRCHRSEESPPLWDIDKIALSYVPCKNFNEHYSKGIEKTLIREILLH